MNREEGTFDIFVDGVRDRSTAGVTSAVQALAPKLAMPPERVARLLSGRFRARSGLDSAMARRVAGDLEALGLVVIVQAAGAQGPAMAKLPATGVPARARSRVPSTSAPQPAPVTNLPAPPRAQPAAAAARASNAAALEEGISIGGLDLDLGVSGLGPPPPAAPPKAASPAGEVAIAEAPSSSFMPSSFGPAIDDADLPLELEGNAAPPPRITSAPPPARKAAPVPAADPFAPPDAAGEGPIDLALDTGHAVPAAPTRPTPSPLGSLARDGAPRLGAPLGRTATREPANASTSASPRALAGALARGLAVMVVALVVGYLPATFYAGRVDAMQVHALQVEYQDLAVNPWKGESTKRTKEKVRQEIEDRRTSATFVMMGIWAATAALLAAAAFVMF
jgi:hypothetical protein